MRFLPFKERFDALIAWHSLFHLTPPAQRLVLNSLPYFIKPGDMLVFPSGDQEEENWSNNGGHDLYYAFLSKKEYEAILKTHHFTIIEYIQQDPACGEATIWLAKYQPFSPSKQ